MARVYLETSFISACLSGRTDAVSMNRKRLSLHWWGHRAKHHAVSVSQEVERELSHPRFTHAKEAIALIRDLPGLEVTDEVAHFSEVLVAERVMPGPAGEGDSLHVAICCVHQVDVLPSWNVKHLANFNKATHLRTVCSRHGLTPPMILTPEYDQ